ncbi:MAG: DUF5667 domain-containing protein [Nocardioides sp.]
MTALFRTRRRAEEFASAVDGRSASLPDDLQQLVGVATALRSHDSLDAARPRDDFAAELRSQLMAEAERTLVPGNAPLTLPARRRGPRERRLVAAASAVVLLGGSAGMAAAAQQSLPGDPLYPIKRGIERAEAGLSVSSAGKGHDLLSQANDRLDEVHAMLAGDSLTANALVPQTIDDFTAQSQEGAGLLMDSFVETRDPATLVAVHEFTAHGIALLQDLARTAPAQAQDELAGAALALGDIDRAATDLCPTCGADLPELEIPDTFLAAAEVDRTLATLDAAALDNSHPFIVDKRSLKEPTKALTDLAAGAAEATEQQAEPAPSDGQSPSTEDSTSSGSLLDLTGADSSSGGKSTTKDVTKDAVKKVTDTVDKTVDDTTSGLTDGLSGAVETVLPDPLGGLGQ